MNESVFLLPEDTLTTHAAVRTILDERGVDANAIPAKTLTLESASLEKLRKAFPFLQFCNVPADGNCFYRVIAQYVFGNHNAHMQVRRHVARMLDYEPYTSTADDDEPPLPQSADSIRLTSSLIPEHAKEGIIFGIMPWAEENANTRVRGSDDPQPLFQFMMKNRLLGQRGTAHPTSSVASAIVSSNFF